MNIAIVTPGTLPVPAVKGGAVETGIQQLIDQNEIHGKVKFTVFSVYNYEAYKKSLSYKNTKVIFIRLNKFNSFHNKFIRAVNRIIKSLQVKKVFNYQYFYIKKITSHLKKMNFDYILIKNLTLSVLPISRITSDRIILQIHNDFLNKDSYKADQIFNTCDKLLVNSNYIKQRALTIENSTEEKIYINKNCTDTDIFNKERYLSETDKLKEKYNIADNDTVIVFSGRIIEQKGVKELILAVKKIPTDLKWKLIIIGGKWFGDNKNTKYMSILEGLSEDIRDKIIFTGFIPYKEIPKIHAISDIAVVPSIWEEPAGRVVLEAQASGLPVVVSDSGGIPDYITKESSIVIRRDEEFIGNLSYALQMLIENRDLRLKMGEAGQKFARRFDPRRYYEELIEILTL